MSELAARPGDSRGYLRPAAIASAVWPIQNGYVVDDVNRRELPSIEQLADPSPGRQLQQPPPQQPPVAVWTLDAARPPEPLKPSVVKSRTDGW